MIDKEYFDQKESSTISDRVLLTPSEFARKNLNYIQEIGKLKSLKPHVSKRGDLESYLFFIVLNGSGTVKVKGKSYHISEGHAVLLDCKEDYEHISDEESQWELAWIHFNGINASAYYSLYKEKNNDMPQCILKNMSEYVQIIEDIMKNKQDKDLMKEVNVSLQIVQILTMLLNDVVITNKDKKGYDFRKLKEQVNEHFRESNLFERLCRENGYDEVTINSAYKEKFGIDLCDYILNRRFTYAKELLRFTVKPVSEIVVESGIGNADLFRHLFIENEGITAEEYRRKWSQWNRG